MSRPCTSFSRALPSCPKPRSRQPPTWRMTATVLTETMTARLSFLLKKNNLFCQNYRLLLFSYLDLHLFYNTKFFFSYRCLNFLIFRFLPYYITYQFLENICLFILFFTTFMFLFLFCMVLPFRYCLHLSMAIVTHFVSYLYNVDNFAFFPTFTHKKRVR